MNELNRYTPPADREPQAPVGSTGLVAAIQRHVAETPATMAGTEAERLLIRAASQLIEARNGLNVIKSYGGTPPDGRDGAWCADQAEIVMRSLDRADRAATD